MFGDQFSLRRLASNGDRAAGKLTIRHSVSRHGILLGYVESTGVRKGVGYVEAFTPDGEMVKRIEMRRRKLPSVEARDKACQVLERHMKR